MMRSLPEIGGDWGGLIVVCAGSAWDSWYPEKHIATHLSKVSPILYVNPSTSPVARRRGNGSRDVGLRQVQPRIAVLSPSTLPAQSHPLIARFTKVLTRRAIKQAVRTLGVSRPLGLVVANHIDLFGATDADHRILYATDDFVAGAALLGLDRGFLEAEERQQAENADGVVVVTETIAQRWRDLGHDPILIPNGCDLKRFEATDEAPLPDDVDLQPPIAGLFGHLSHRIDISLLEAVAASGVSLLLVGTRQQSFSLGSLLAFDNVRYLGPRPFEVMPSYLRAIDVGLTPYSDSAFNRASFPMKTLEYLAAGRAAVSTSLPAVRWLDTDLIATADNPREFAVAVQRELDRPLSNEMISVRRAFAAQHSWAARASAFAGVLGLELDVGDAGTVR